MPMTPPILTDKSVSNYLRVGGEVQVGIPDHRNMAIFQLANKFTFARMSTSDTSRLAVWFLLIFHGRASRRLVSEEGGR